MFPEPSTVEEERLHDARPEALRQGFPQGFSLLCQGAVEATITVALRSYVVYEDMFGCQARRVLR